MSALSVDTLPATGLWNIDSGHSTARFAVRHHAIATFSGGFTDITGHYDGSTGQLVGEVRVDHADLHGLDKLKAHFLTPDFFDADAHPTLSFESRRIQVDGDGLTVTGDLTMRGVTRPVSASGTVRGPITIRHQEGHFSRRLAIDITTTVDRRDFGINQNGEIADGVLNLGWDVTIRIALELIEALS